MSVDGLAQAELVAAREITALELVEATIERIEAINPRLNAIVTPMYEIALGRARAPLPRGPLAGVPILLKDYIASYEGIRQTEGSAFLADNVASNDSELVRRLKRAGLIVVGKTNTAEFGNASTTEPALFGPTRNPWNLDRSPGGSSGGSAAAVAAGLVPIAHGSDWGGSIRIPASCCGLFGLKPTRGRNSLGPWYGDIYCGLTAEHALSRTVRDSAALLDITSGPAAGDPHTAPAPSRPFREEVGAAPGRLRIGFSAQAPTGVAVHEACVEAVHQAAEACSELGHEVEEASPQYDATAAEKALWMLIAAGSAATVDGWSRRIGRIAEPDSLEPFTWALCELGRARTAPQHLLDVETLQRIPRQVAPFFERYDVWLTPTLAEPPPPLGYLVAPHEDPLQLAEIDGRFAPFNWIANVTGQPAMSVPLAWDPRELPVGSQFIARFGDEKTLFRLAAQLEEHHPWAERQPGVFAALET